MKALLCSHNPHRRLGQLFLAVARKVVRWAGFHVVSNTPILLFNICAWLMMSCVCVCACFSCLVLTVSVYFVSRFDVVNLLLLTSCTSFLVCISNPLPIAPVCCIAFYLIWYDVNRRIVIVLLINKIYVICIISQKQNSIISNLTLRPDVSWFCRYRP